MRVTPTIPPRMAAFLALMFLGSSELAMCAPRPGRVDKQLAAHASTDQAQDAAQSSQPPWDARLEKSDDGYRVVSTTNLAGAPAKTGRGSLIKISSGAIGTWKWTVKADPLLLDSWKTYQQAKRVRDSEPLAADDWNYPAYDWKRGFERTYALAKYLLGRDPAALNATILLTPDGQKYRNTRGQIAKSGVPITLGFPFPAGTSSQKSEQAKRDGAVVQAIAETVYQYMRVLVDESVISLKGQYKAAQDVNKEGTGVCWVESSWMNITAAGGHTRVSFHWSQQASADELERRPPSKIPTDKAGYWASLREAESISGYLEMKGLKNHKFSSKDPAAMNAVLSVCRAMTQHPVDLTLGPYPPSQIQYVPFFPAKLK